MSHKVALVIAAHPDDPEFGLGGTVALWSQEGWDFHFLIVTDGSKGTPDPHCDALALVNQRQQEQREAARILGAHSVSFLGHIDGEVVAGRELLGQMVGHIRQLRPDAVFAHSPEALEYRRPGGPPHIAHRDHRVCGQTALDAVYPAARDPHNFPGAEPHKVPLVFLWGHPQADTAVEITSVWERKVQALQAHASQVPGGEAWPQRLRERCLEGQSIYEYFLKIQVPV